MIAALSGTTLHALVFLKNPMTKLTLWTGTVVNARTDALNGLIHQYRCCIIVECAFKNVSVKLCFSTLLSCLVEIVNVCYNCLVMVVNVWKPPS